MKKALMILFLLTASASWGAEFDPYSMQFWYTSPDYEARVYGQYGNSDYNFFYQVNDVAGASRAERVAGPQWFATVYENYYYALRGRTGQTNWGIYRRTLGGEIPDKTFQTVGDLIHGFNFIFTEEPEPYESAWRSRVGTEVYDVYPDPLESLCLLITNGRSDFNIEFGNPYARHFPFWWYRTTSSSSSSSARWWQPVYDWRTETYPIQEPMAYVFSSPDIYVRNDTTRRFVASYKLKTSGDKQLILDSSSVCRYIISGDSVYTSPDQTLTWSFNESRDKVYDASGNLRYTVETDSAGDKFICDVRTVYESVSFSDFDGNYTISVNPTGEQPVQSGSSLQATVSVRGMAGTDYGSKLGYITFRQRADFAKGYTGYREFTTVPLVIANVAQGNASVTPLLFDMIVTDSTDVVSRIKFTWDAQTDNLNQDFGTFFMIGSSNSPYKLETRITNRTGTRYELYRYDMIGTRNSNPTYRDNYSSIMPDHWKYDLTPDMYGTLPDSFLLDAHSQIAPGLVTVYKNNIAEGYRTLSTSTDVSESFRLTEYASGSPKNLRLNYRIIRGMTPLENGTYVPFDGVKLREFSMQFADVAQNSDQTVAELTALMGKAPAMITQEAASDPAAVQRAFVSSSAIAPFSYARKVPEGLVRLRSEDNSPTTSQDKPRGVMYPSAVTFTSLDIPVVPMSIRMKVQRDSQLLAGHWDDLNNAANSREVFNIFSKYGTVWVRSDSTAERDADLFAAINNKGSGQGVGAVDCVRTFIYDDELYVDFIVLLADGKSTRSGRTAYVEVFKDDNVPYILIGDGKENGIWEMTFYIAPVSSSSGSTTSEDLPSSNGSGVANNRSSGGGGGCNAGVMMFGLLLLLKRK